MADEYIVVRMLGKIAIPIRREFNEQVGYLREDQEPTRFNLGLAKDYANYWTQCFGCNYQVRPLVPKDFDWRQRERDRFESKHYTKLPWHDEEWAQQCHDHFAHVGRSNPALIAYTIDEGKALRDVKNVLRPTRYLKQHYSKILTETAIREWAAKYKKLYDPEDLLHFAYTRDEIKKVYLNGPQSCMSKTLNVLVHPSEAYSGPDLAIAYVRKQNRIVARALCWPKKQIYSRMYGDTELLSELLEDEGFEQRFSREGRDDAFVGARLTKIIHNNRFICPFIDGYSRVRVGKRYLTIDPKGKWACQNQDGYCGTPFRCRKCDQSYDQGKMPSCHVENVLWCHNCFQKEADNLHHCDFLLRNDPRRYANHWYRHEHLVRMGNGEYWLHDYAHRLDCAFECQECNLRLPIEMASPKYWKYDRYTGCNLYYKCLDCATKQGEFEI